MSSTRGDDQPDDGREDAATDAARLEAELDRYIEQVTRLIREDAAKGRARTRDDSTSGERR